MKLIPQTGECPVCGKRLRLNHPVWIGPNDSDGVRLLRGHKKRKWINCEGRVPVDGSIRNVEAVTT